MGIEDIVSDLPNEKPNWGFSLSDELEVHENAKTLLSPRRAEGEGFNKPVVRNRSVTDTLAVWGMLVARQELKPRSNTRL